MKVNRNYEIWKDIKGFPGYEISYFGRVKSLKRWIKNFKAINKIGLKKEKILKSGLNSKGYPSIVLRKNNKSCTKTIHLIVIDHFGPPKPTPKHECNHKDGDKTNNWWTNLEWMTGKENVNHAHKLDLVKHTEGEKHYHNKISKIDVIKIRKLWKTNKYQQNKLAKMFNTSSTNIRNIINFKTWKSIK